MLKCLIINAINFLFYFAFSQQPISLFISWLVCRRSSSQEKAFTVDFVGVVCEVEPVEVDLAIQAVKAV